MQSGYVTGCNWNSNQKENSFRFLVDRKLYFVNVWDEYTDWVYV